MNLPRYLLRYFFQKTLNKQKQIKMYKIEIHIDKTNCWHKISVSTKKLSKSKQYTNVINYQKILVSYFEGQAKIEGLEKNTKQLFNLM